MRTNCGAPRALASTSPPTVPPSSTCSAAPSARLANPTWMRPHENDPACLGGPAGLSDGGAQGSYRRGALCAPGGRPTTATPAGTTRSPVTGVRNRRAAGPAGGLLGPVRPDPLPVAAPVRTRARGRPGTGPGHDRPGGAVLGPGLFDRGAGAAGFPAHVPGIPVLPDPGGDPRLAGSARPCLHPDGATAGGTQQPLWRNLS